MTTPAPTVVKTITEAEIRDVTHYCHFIAAPAATIGQTLLESLPSGHWSPTASRST
jgi:hypothetical protein